MIATRKFCPVPGLLLGLILAAVLVSGCGLIYKQNIQQGNAIEQEDLDELYLGMNKRQVLFVLGTPSIRDPFQQDRWDYVQTFSRRGGDMVMRTVTLRFENDMLEEILGQDDPFSADGNDDSGAIASFVKPETVPENETSDDGADSPQDMALESAEAEILDPEPDIDAVRERNAEDREYRRDQEILDQTPDGDLSGPDIDG